jgi:tRNA threonylcarbamoyl adenosine modification protein YeaZ
MHSYIIIHHTYQTCEVALFIDHTLYDIMIEEKRFTSKMLIFMIDTILQRNNKKLADLSFIGINQGPGLFSTLRSIIATVNGLRCAVGIPLIGIDALDTTAQEFYDEKYPVSATLLDAYNHEVYYAITENKQIIAKGYEKIEQFLLMLEEKYPSKQIRFVGQGTQLYKNMIVSEGKGNFIVSDDIPLLCSVNMIGKRAFEVFLTQKNKYEYLFPLHLKKHPVEKQ